MMMMMMLLLTTISDMSFGGGDDDAIVVLPRRFIWSSYSTVQSLSSFLLLKLFHTVPGRPLFSFVELPPSHARRSFPGSGPPSLPRLLLPSGSFLSLGVFYLLFPVAAAVPVPTYVSLFQRGDAYQTGPALYRLRQDSAGDGLAQAKDRRLHTKSTGAPPPVPTPLSCCDYSSYCTIFWLCPVFTTVLFSYCLYRALPNPPPPT
ncbi:uncharacterized protein LY89DRAFT_234239 [Mollisia scopiformis]|uniref:Uncharacterized protein n=1 Tax=Mollisia scopiformis TaxID=149040 RepID=A0A194WUY4_MOLSC|nr:uncharacterized protein LY89DRAFT_234239 [Mollisia scopiformis]KUJ11781.1 hypothetical protein LY89DRAFT_234239 [Mollisia scopiformis]